MRYKFMGNRDVPEWILAEVTGLSKISCVRMKLICKQVINELLGGEVDFLKVQRLIPKGAGFTLSDIKAAVAAMHFILAQATRHGVEHSVLNQELQQLGLPKENSDGISRPFRNNRALLQRRFRDELVSLPRIRALEWRTDCVLASSLLPTPRIVPVVHLRVSTTHTLRTRAPPSPAVPASLVNPDSATSSSSAAAPSSSESLGRTSLAPALSLGVGPTSKASYAGEGFSVELGAEQFRLLFHELTKARAVLHTLGLAAATTA